MQAIAVPYLGEDADRDERRRYLRVALRCECWLESEEASLFAATADLGLGGLFLRTAIPIREGQRVRVALCLGPGGESFEADGLITRSVPARRGWRHGIGVEFVELGAAREGLKRFLNGR